MIFEVFSFGEQGAWLQLCNARGKRKQPKRAAKTATAKTKTIAWRVIRKPLYTTTASVILSDSEESVLDECAVGCPRFFTALRSRMTGRDQRQRKT